VGFFSHKVTAVATPSNTASDPRAKVLAQWERMKQTIASDPQLSRMELNVLWPRMLSRSGFVRQFSLVLRIVGIAVTFTVDTSGCERLISLMNDLKTKFQEDGTRVPTRSSLVAQK
jgi:hypothetical protein